jgi:fibronectin-binding autotransporter adhesin
MKPRFNRSNSRRHSASVLGAAACALALGTVAANAQTTFNWTGGGDGTGSAMFDAAGYVNWNPTLTATDIAAASDNIFLIASRTNGGPSDPIGAGELPTLGIADTYIRSLKFENNAGHFPEPFLLVGRPSPSTALTRLHFTVPDTTIVDLDESVSGVVKLGNATASGTTLVRTHGDFGLRLPASGVSTFHVGNASATLDLTGAVNNQTGFGAIHGGTSTTVTLDAAKIRKTGPGTLDLRTVDGQGNRVLGTIIEGGTVIISSAPQLGWNPADPMPDHLVINGGTLNLVGLSTGPGTNRGIQVGENQGTFQVDGATLVSGPITDVPGQAGVLVKTGPSAFRLGSENSYSGGTLVQAGVLRATTSSSFGTGIVSISDGAGISTFGVAIDNPAPLLPNPVEVLGGNVIFGDSGTNLASNTLRLGGGVNLNGNNVAMQIDYNTEMDGVVSNGTIPSITGRNNDHSLVLNASNTFTGSTTVERGALIVNGGITANLTANRGVIDPAAVGSLGGEGTIIGNVIVNGELRPGAAFANATGTLSVNGSLTLNSTSKLILEIGSAAEIDQIAATGGVSIDGAIEVSLINGYDPEVDDAFQLVDLSGNISLGPNHTLSLPFLGASKLWDASDFETTGTVTVIAGSVTRDTFTWTSEFPGTGISLTDPSNFNQWDPEVVPGSFDFGTANTFILATKPGDPAVAADYTFTLDGSPRAETFVFDDPAGLFPATVNVHANASGTDQRVIWFDLPDTTAISLGNDFTSTLRFGGDPLVSGPLGFRLPSSGTTTFHVSNELATLDLGGLLNNDPGRGAIHAGATAQSSTAHARIRKTGEGTLDLRYVGEPEGTRALGLTVEGGRVLVNGNEQIGWNPTAVMPDHIVLNGGTLVFSQLNNPGVNRGIMVGENGGRIENTAQVIGLDALIQDVPGEQGVLIKSGSIILRVGNNDNSYSGGTVIEQGRLRFSTNGALGGGPVTMLDGTGLIQSVAGLILPNDILIAGDSARFNNDGFIQAHSGTIDLDGGTKVIRCTGTTQFFGDVTNGGIIVQTDLNAQRLELFADNSYEDGTTVDRGRLVVNGSINGDVIVTRGILVDVAIGGLGGNGVIHGSAIIGGQLQPGSATGNTIGTLQINGDLNLDPTGIAVFEIAAAGSHDKITGLTSATVDGTISVVLLDGYEPTVGTTFHLVDSADEIFIGNDAQFSLPTLPAGRVWDTGSFAADGTLAVVSGSGDAYEAWAAANGLVGADADRNFDFDKDGFTNLQEYLFGGNPTASTPGLTQISRSGATVTVTYLELIAGASYTILANGNLAGTWNPAAGITMVDPVDQTGVPAGYVRRQFTSPIGSRDFFRVEGSED